MNTIFHQTVKIIQNELAAENTWRVRLASKEIAESVKPGQFCMLRIPGVRAPLLGRPLAIFRAEEGAVDVVYAVVGHGTEQLSRLLPGQEMEIWGPLGNGFRLDADPEKWPMRPLLVGGGIGQTPMYLLAREFLKQPKTEKVTFVWGCRNAGSFACLEDLEALAAQYPGRMEIRLATDDGSRGHHGFVTELEKECIASEQLHAGNACVYACGPEVMLKNVAKIAASAGLECQVSLETPMACGMGICFTCVTKCKDSEAPEGWDYCRTCTEGPVFDAKKLLWD